MISPICMVYGLSIDSLRNEYDMQDIILLSKSAWKLLSKLHGLFTVSEDNPESDCPDVEGFRSMFPKQFKEVAILHWLMNYL